MYNQTHKDVNNIKQSYSSTALADDSNPYIYKDRSFNSLYIKSLRTPDIELCEAIASGGSHRQKAIETIYGWSELKQKVANYVMRNSGSRDDGRDIFHDGIVALDRNIRNDKFKGESSLQGYLYTICRFTWNNERRRRAKVQTNELQEFQEEVDNVTPEISMRSKEEKQVLGQVIDLLDDSCKQILTLWKMSYSMTEIAERLELSSPAMAKKYRYRCMKKLMAALATRPKLMETLKNV